MQTFLTLTLTLTLGLTATDWNKPVVPYGLDTTQDQIYYREHERFQLDHRSNFIHPSPKRARVPTGPVFLSRVSIRRQLD